MYEHEDDSDDDDPHHGKPSAHSSGWHTAVTGTPVAVIAVTKMNANPLETLLTSMNAPVAFTGFGGAIDSLAGRTRRLESGAEQPYSAR